MEQAVVGRRSGRRITPAQSSTARVFFGPFEPGEGVDGLYVTLDQTFTLTIDPVTGVGTGTALSVQLAAIDVRAFTAQPTDSNAAFQAQGRPVYGDGIAGNLPRISVKANRHRLPLAWIASRAERWLGVEITELNAVTTLDGAVFCRMSPTAAVERKPVVTGEDK